MRPYPDKIVRSVFDITPDFLLAHGFCALLVDVDGTISKTHSHALEPGVSAWVAQLKEHGIKVMLLSNHRTPGRIAPVAQALAVPYVERAGKPRKQGFLRACGQLGIPPAAAAAVGDKIYTDILGARRAGIYAILARSLDTDLPTSAFKRFLEKPFIKENDYV